MHFTNIYLKKKIPSHNIDHWKICSIVMKIMSHCKLFLMVLKNAPFLLYKKVKYVLDISYKLP